MIGLSQVAERWLFDDRPTIECRRAEGVRTQGTTNVLDSSSISIRVIVAVELSG